MFLFWFVPKLKSLSFLFLLMLSIESFTFQWIIFITQFFFRFQYQMHSQLKLRFIKIIQEWKRCQLQNQSRFFSSKMISYFEMMIRHEMHFSSNWKASWKIFHVEKCHVLCPNKNEFDLPQEKLFKCNFLIFTLFFCSI